MSRKIVILLAIVCLSHVTLTSGKPSGKKHCKKNETWSTCYASCEKSCGFPDGKRCLSKTPGCICQEGLVRNKHGDCVNQSDCGDERRGPVTFRYDDNN